MPDSKMEPFTPGISLALREGKIRIFHSTIVTLGEPRYIRFLLNINMRCLAVQGVEEQAVDCFSVPAYTPENWDFKISSTNFLKNIWAICCWDPAATYRAKGIYDGDHDMVQFKLDQAWKLIDK